MKLKDHRLAQSLQLAYSAERAAAFAYIGHAASLKNQTEKQRVKEIEDDEWDHRAHVLKIMKQYEIPVSRFYEIKYFIIGKIISWSCFIIGRFMPYFFAGKLESGNVCEYFVMIKKFRDLGIYEHDQILYDMGVKEKEHEEFFLEIASKDSWMPYFDKIFSWGKNKSQNDVDLNELLPLEKATEYCKKWER